jgi:hypothetical protein
VTCIVGLGAAMQYAAHHCLVRATALQLFSTAGTAVLLHAYCIRCLQSLCGSTWSPLPLAPTTQPSTPQPTTPTVTRQTTRSAWPASVAMTTWQPRSLAGTRELSVTCHLLIIPCSAVLRAIRSSCTECQGCTRLQQQAATTTLHHKPVPFMLHGELARSAYVLPLGLAMADE